jgi:putative ABC transport system permease protein
MSAFISTIGQACRSLGRARTLSAAAALCIGLGAAATTTVATLVSAVLLRPVPFPDAERLVRIWFEEPGVNARISLSIPDAADFARIEAFDGFAATARVRTTARLDQGAERLRGEGVSRGYFEMLGLRAAAGRLLLPSDHAPDAPPVVVLGHGTWLRRYGGDPGVIGGDFSTERAVYTIVGVSQEGFEGTVEDDIVEFFIPIERYEPRALITTRSARPTWVIGRLRPEASIEVAQQAAERVHRALVETYPEMYRQWRVRVEPFGESWRERLRSGGGVLFGAAALLLAIAAVNVGCLLLARVLDRRRELAIRAALGGARGWIAAQLFTEALILVTAGGAIGALAGPWLLDAFLAVSPLGRLALPRYLQLEPDWTTLALSVGALAVAGLLAGTAPALLGRRVMPADVLRESGRGTVGSGAEKRWSALLIAGETALTLGLLVAGGLLLRSYERLSSVEMGFDRERIARLAVTLSRSDVGDPARLPAVYERLRRALAAVPGVARVGLVHPTLPPWEGYRAPVRLEGVDLPQAPNGLQAGTHLIDEELLPTLGAGILAGRNIQAGDHSSPAPVAVISRSLARLFGGPERAVGRTITFLRDDPEMPSGAFTVVGVAENVAYDGLVDEDTRQFVRGDGADPRAARFDVYVPLGRFPMTVVSIGAYTTAEPAAMLEPLRRKIAEIAPSSATHWIVTMQEEIALEYESARFYTILVIAFSSSALALTGVGLFALLSHAAARRAGEMGLRLALGASRAAIAGLLLKSGLLPVAGGIGVGAIAATIGGRSMSGLLYGIGPFDALAFAGAAAALLAVALGAGVLPARRVASIDPVETLRNA